LRITAACLFVFLLAIAAMPQNPAQPAEVIFQNADIYSGVARLENGAVLSVAPRAQALAVTQGKIVAIGSSEDVKKWQGPQTQVIDLAGHFVMPGFNDAHLHLGSAGMSKLEVDLVGVRSLDEMKQRIAEGVKRARPGEWLRGRGWDHTLWSSQQLPTRQDLDAVTESHPAFFVRVDGHIAVSNTLALKAAGLTKDSKDVPGGKADRDAKGELTGIVRERTKDDFYKVIPKPTAEQHQRAMELALADAARWGITSAQDNSDWEDFLALEQLEREGKLTVRVTEWLPFKASLERLKQARAHHAQNDTMLHTTMLKGFMDGSLGSRTAALLAPYADDPENSGLPQYTQQELTQMAVERVAAGFQLGFHAIGDRGTEMALNAFDAALKAAAHNHSITPAGSTGSGDYRLRIEHAQVVAPKDFSRFRDLHVIASMQPNHLLTDMNWAESRIGPDRSRSSYAWKTFLNNRVVLAFGTDYPVEPITPFRGVYASVTRKNEAGTKTYYPEERLSIDEALRAYTVGSAYAEFAEKQKGTLEPGKLADFVVLDRDLTKIPAPEILGTRVLRTVVGGKTVCEAH
jgi:predicted amidohydrolase YtcJ